MREISATERGASEKDVSIRERASENDRHGCTISDGFISLNFHFLGFYIS